MALHCYMLEYAREVVMHDDETLFLDYGFAEQAGSGCLVGAVCKKFDCIPQKVTLVFPQPSAAWLASNKGPHLSIVASHVVSCLLEDMLALQSHGCVVSVQTVIRDPE
jgi:hypothetical protein